MLNGRKATKELLKAMEQAEKPVTNADRIRTVSDDEPIARRLIELLKEVQDYGKYQRGAGLYSIRNEIVADHLIANGVTVQELDGCEYCKEDNEGYRKMNGAFSITNPFHGSVWNIETCHCKPRRIYFCPMCGRKLPNCGAKMDGDGNG